MLAVGEQLFGHVDDQMLKLSTGFAGGIGGTQQELCGALSAGIMLIGGLYGRAQPEVDDRRCQALAARYRDQFVATFGTTCCRELRQHQRPCALLVERAALLLLETIEEDRAHAQDHLRD
jgi:C_GCAxxG_C_C family probable redox protein